MKVPDVCDVLAGLSLDNSTKKSWVARARADKEKVAKLTVALRKLELCSCKTDTCLTCTMNDLLRLGQEMSSATDNLPTPALGSPPVLPTPPLCSSPVPTTMPQPTVMPTPPVCPPTVPATMPQPAAAPIPATAPATMPQPATMPAPAQCTVSGGPERSLTLQDGSVYACGVSWKVGRFLVQSWIVAGTTQQSHPSPGPATPVSNNSAFSKLFSRKDPVKQPKKKRAPSKLKLRTTKQRSQECKPALVSDTRRRTQRDISEFFSRRSDGPIRDEETSSD